MNSPADPTNSKCFGRPRVSDLRTFRCELCHGSEFHDVLVGPGEVLVCHINDPQQVWTNQQSQPTIWLWVNDMGLPTNPGGVKDPTSWTSLVPGVQGTATSGNHQCLVATARTLMVGQGWAINLNGGPIRRTLPVGSTGASSWKAEAPDDSS